MNLVHPAGPFVRAANPPETTLRPLAEAAEQRRTGRRRSSRSASDLAWSQCSPIGSRPDRLHTPSDTSAEGDFGQIEPDEPIERSERLNAQLVEHACRAPLFTAGTQRRVRHLMIQDRFDIDLRRPGRQPDQQRPKAQLRNLVDLHVLSVARMHGPCYCLPDPAGGTPPPLRPGRRWWCNPSAPGSSARTIY